MPFRHPHPLYQTWLNMKQRCRNPRSPQFSHYGGRGIKVCARWDTFANFVEDMGEKPGPGYSVDRIDNDGNYEPGNCRWATSTVQNRNQRRTRRVEVGGQALEAVELAEVAGVKTDTITDRVRRGLLLPQVLQSGTTRDPDEWRASVRNANVASASRRREATHCKRGHEFTAENTQITRDGKGRRCRECTGLRDLKYRGIAVPQLAYQLMEAR